MVDLQYNVFNPVSSVSSRQLLGEILIGRGQLSQKDLESALAVQLKLGGLLGQTLVRLGSISENDLLEALSSQMAIPMAASSSLPSVAAIVEAAESLRINPQWLLIREAVVWFKENGRLQIACRTPQDPTLREAAEHWAETIEWHLAGQQDLLPLLEQVTVQHSSTRSLSNNVGDETLRLREIAEEAPVIDFVNSMFAEAQTRRASDVHIEPFEDRFIVRFRVDGILHHWRSSPRSSFEAVASRIKLLSGMDIAERRLPQDGRQTIRVSGRDIDLRVSSFPAIWGESLVMRLLGKTRQLPQLDSLGVLSDHQLLLANLANQPNGVVLVTGPTGSGKTTTIYRLLMGLNDGVRKIVTVEDPVEFELPGIVQMQVKADIGLTFATGLRSILRQDPDVILVGEIRDTETARIAIQAALTGHLVFSTLHTNSCLAAVPRLLDLDVEGYLLADVLRGLIGQRLARRLCSHCKTPQPHREWEWAEQKLFERRLAPGDAQPAYSEATGCGQCGGSGYQGRLGIYEVAASTDGIVSAIRDRAPEATLLAEAQAAGFRSMAEDGLLKARQGLTSLSEVKRITAAQ